MNPGQRALTAGLGLAFLDGLLLAILFANTCCGDSPNGLGLFIAFLLGLAATVLTQIGIIAWGVELGTRSLAASLSHAASPNAPPSPRISCDHCGDIFTDEATYGAHVRVHHWEKA